MLYKTDLEGNLNVCPKCEHHHRIGARARLDAFLDPEGRFEIGQEVVPVDADEYETMGCNILAVAPRRVVMVNGSPRTRAALESAGCEVHGYDGSGISLKGDGGPTCLTAPTCSCQSSSISA